MTAADVLERFCRRPSPAFVNGLDSLLEGRDRFEMLGPVEKLLVGRSILDDELGPAIDRQDKRRACLLESVDELGGAVSEVGQGIGFDAGVHGGVLQGEDIRQGLESRNLAVKSKW